MRRLLACLATTFLVVSSPDAQAQRIALVGYPAHRSTRLASLVRGVNLKTVHRLDAIRGFCGVILIIRDRDWPDVAYLRQVGDFVRAGGRAIVFVSIGQHPPEHAISGLGSAIRRNFGVSMREGRVFDQDVVPNRRYLPTLGDGKIGISGTFSNIWFEPADSTAVLSNATDEVRAVSLELVLGRGSIILAAGGTSPNPFFSDVNIQGHDNEGISRNMIGWLVAANYREVAQEERYGISKLRGMRRRADACRDNGEYGRAEKIYREILQISTKELMPSEVSSALIDLIEFSGSCIDRGDLKRSEGICRAILKLSDKQSLPGLRLRLLGLPKVRVSIGSGHWDRRRLEEGIRDTIASKRPHILAGLARLADAYENEGRYRRAESIYREALELSTRDSIISEVPRILAGLSRLAVVYKNRGKYEQAERILREILELSISDGFHAEAARILDSMAEIYEKQENYGGIEQLYERSLETIQERVGHIPPEIARSSIRLARVYGRQGRDDLAAQHYNRVLEICGRIDGIRRDSEEMHILGELLELYETQGQYGEIEKLYRRAAEMNASKLGRQHTEVTDLRNRLAGFYFLRGRHAEAEILHIELLAEEERVSGPQHPNVAQMLTNFAAAELALNRHGVALSFLQRALSIEDHLIESVFSDASETDKLHFLDLMWFRFCLIQSIALRHLADGEEARDLALSAALNRKGLVLDALSRERKMLLGSDDPKAREIMHKHQTTISQLASMTLSGPGELSIHDHMARLEELRKERDGLEEELAGLSASIGTERGRPKADAVQVGRVLKPGQVLVEYINTWVDYEFNRSGQIERFKNDRYLAYVLSGGQETKPVLVDIGDAEEINRSVGDLREEMTRAAEIIHLVGEQEAESRLMEKSNRVYQLVFAPLRKSLEGMQELFIAPDDQLNLIPFGILTDEEGSYLAETWQLNYVSSGRDLLQFGKKTTGRGMVIFADPDYDADPEGAPSIHIETEVVMPGSGGWADDLGQMEWAALPGTRKEAEAIARESPKKPVTMHLGNAAVEKAVKNVKAPAILHLATHGFFLEDQILFDRQEVAGATRGFGMSSNGRERALPSIEIENPLLRAGLVVAGANRLGKARLPEGADDGILTALEISGMQLWETDLVVLSACETGVGKAKRGEGVFGLRRAFQLAGARTVVMSLWSVPDQETVILMEGFYRRMSAGLGKARALQESCLDAMRHRREQFGAAHPFYWGAFVCVGDP